jgi:tetratricopeptide (TPR) repeat protein
VTGFLIALLAALQTTNQTAAIGNSTKQTTNVSLPSPRAADPAEKEYHQLLEEDDDAHEEIDQWIKDNEKFAAKGAGLSREDLNRRIKDRLAPVRKHYEEFLKAHPDHARAHVAFGSFLGDLNDDEGAQKQLELSLQSDTNNPAAYNNLANIYGHSGDVKKSFEFYTKAIDLNPNEPVYYHNFGTTVYLFRKDAKEYYKIGEQQVFDKALELYSNALRLDPADFNLASDIAQTFYGIKPTRTNDALKAWTNALAIAHDEVEREGVYIHFARIKMHAGKFDEAQQHLAAITNQMYALLKAHLQRNLAAIKAGTNTPDPLPEIKKLDLSSPAVRTKNNE